MCMVISPMQRHPWPGSNLGDSASSRGNIWFWPSLACSCPAQSIFHGEEENWPACIWLLLLLTDHLDCCPCPCRRCCCRQVCMTDKINAMWSELFVRQAVTSVFPPFPRPLQSRFPALPLPSRHEAGRVRKEGKARLYKVGGRSEFSWQVGNRQRYPWAHWQVSIYICFEIYTRTISNFPKTATETLITLVALAVFSKLCNNISFHLYIFFVLILFQGL